MTTLEVSASRARTIRFEEWKGEIQGAVDVDQLVMLIRAYMATWQPEQLKFLPWDLAATAVANSEAIVARAVMASRLELRFQGGEAEYRLLREMSLTFSAAANRLRYLQSTSRYVRP